VSSSESARFVATIPAQLSPADDRRALARLRSLQRLSNDVLATYLARAATYRRDGDLPRLRAERIVAVAEGRLAPKSRLTDSVAQQVVVRCHNDDDR
jgi:hypothetical protein